MIYRSSEVQAMTGATRHQLDHWKRRGIVTPSDQTPGGQARYSRKDVRRVRLLVLLTSTTRDDWKPISVRKAGEILPMLAREVEGWLEVERAEATVKAMETVGA